MRGITYKKSGVDIRKASLFKKKLKGLVRSSFRKEVLKGIGGFGSFFAFPARKYRDPVLVSSSDGVGTKLKIAFLAARHDTVGIDAVAMNVNDILCTGAEPLFFLDYIAYSKTREKVLLDVVTGINRGCIESGCSLIGGETAQMPGMYPPGEYDIAGFCVGVVERSRIIDGSHISKGNLIVGLESSGLHSNGFSLVRKVLSQRELKERARQLLTPTRIYVRPVLSLLADTRYLLPKPAITGIAHITGGAFYDKIARILPPDKDAIIYKDSWRVPEIFSFIRDKGGVSQREMFGTLNMGIGMVLVVERRALRGVLSELSAHRLHSWVIGEIVKGKGKVEVI